MFDLLTWLRRAPKPTRLRLKTHDGEERYIDLGKSRVRWADIESSVRSSDAATVQCLAENGDILRALDLSDKEGDEDEPKEDKSLNKAIRDQAAMLDRYGARLNESFAMGAKAASQSSDKLVELVEVLTNHLAIAITNVNNLSVNLSNALQATNGGESNPEQNPAMAMLTAMLQAKMALPAAPAAPPKTNGTKKP